MDYVARTIDSGNPARCLVLARLARLCSDLGLGILSWKGLSRLEDGGELRRLAVRSWLENQ